MSHNVDEPLPLSGRQLTDAAPEASPAAQRDECPRRLPKACFIRQVFEGIAAFDRGYQGATRDFKKQLLVPASE